MFINVKVIRKPRFIEFGMSPSTTTLVCGVGRSGTSWVGNVVANMTRSRVVFEPFLTNNNGEFSLFAADGCGHLDNRSEFPVYFKDINIDEQMRRQIEKILFGAVKGGWVNQDLDSGVYYRRVIKEIRINLLLPPILRVWPELRVVYLIRSPYAVVDSMVTKIKSGWLFDWSVEKILINKSLMADYLSPFSGLIESCQTLPERLALRWCIENYIVLRELMNNDSVKFHQYEKLHNGSGWAEMGDFLKDRGWRGVPDMRLLGRPSRTASDTLLNGRCTELSSLGQVDVDNIARIVSAFGLDDVVHNAAPIR